MQADSLVQSLIATFSPNNLTGENEGKGLAQSIGKSLDKSNDQSGMNDFSKTLDKAGLKDNIREAKATVKKEINEFKEQLKGPKKPEKPEDPVAAPTENAKEIQDVARSKTDEAPVAAKSADGQKEQTHTNSVTKTDPNQPVKQDALNSAIDRIEQAISKLRASLEANGIEVPPELNVALAGLQDTLDQFLNLPEGVAATQVTYVEFTVKISQQVGTSLDALSASLTNILNQLLGRVNAGQLGINANLLANSDVPDAAQLTEFSFQSTTITRANSASLNPVGQQLAQQIQASVKSLLESVEEFTQQVKVLANQAPQTIQAETLQASRVIAAPDVESTETVNVKDLVPANSNQAQATQTTNQPGGAAVQALAASTGGQTGTQTNSGGGQSFGASPQAIIPTTSAQGGLQNIALTRGAESFESLLKPEMRGQVTEQVTFQMKSAIKNGDSRFVVKIDPPELGEVEIKLQVGKDGRTGMIISVERPQTLDMLQRDARLLLDTLNEAGLQADAGDLSFNLKDQDESSQQQMQAAKNYPVNEEEFDEEMLLVASNDYQIENNMGLNIKI